MKETRKYYDGFSGASYLVNVRTGQVRHSLTSEYPAEDVIARVLKAVQGRIKSAANRSNMDDVRRSCGLVKVRGALGGIYWE